MRASGRTIGKFFGNRSRLPAFEFPDMSLLESRAKIAKSLVFFRLWRAEKSINAEIHARDVRFSRTFPKMARPLPGCAKVDWAVWEILDPVVMRLEMGRRDGAGQPGRLPRT
jgi:hypothetical protein